MAKQLQGVEAEYVFFAAYLAKDDEQASSDVNGKQTRGSATLGNKALIYLQAPC